MNVLTFGQQLFAWQKITTLTVKFQVFLTLINFNNNASCSSAEDIFEKFALQCCKLMKVIVKCNMYQPPREIKGRMTLRYGKYTLFREGGTE